jgi:hypothetical protein
LGRNSAFNVFEGHAAEEQALDSGLEGGVDDHPGPTVAHEIGEQRDLDCYVDVADHLLDLGPDDGVSQRFEHVKLTSVVENDRSQPGPIDLAVVYDIGPSNADRLGSAATGGEHVVTDQIGVDHLYTSGSEKAPHRALPGTDAAAEQDPDPLGHRRGL